MWGMFRMGNARYTHKSLVGTPARKGHMSKLVIKCSRYRPGCGPEVGRGIALLFQDHGTRRGLVVSSTPRPYFTPGKDPIPIVEGAGWTPGPVWTGGKSRPTGIRSPDRPARSQSLYRLSYPAHKTSHRWLDNVKWIGYGCMTGSTWPVVLSLVGGKIDDLLNKVKVELSLRTA